jgi:hypothetical protein
MEEDIAKAESLKSALRHIRDAIVHLSDASVALHFAGRRSAGPVAEAPVTNAKICVIPWVSCWPRRAATANGRCSPRCPNGKEPLDSSRSGVLAPIAEHVDIGVRQLPVRPFEAGVHPQRRHRDERSGQR